MNKRGQFFLFAAVVISAIIISLIATANKAKTLPEPIEIKTLPPQIKQESNKVISYQIYNPSNKEELENFVSKLRAYLIDKEPDTNFMFIYGNSSKLIVENYSPLKAKASFGSCQTNQACQKKFILGGGKKIQTTISFKSFAKSTLQNMLNNRLYKETFTQNNQNIKKDVPLQIEVGGYKYNFNITKNYQLILLLQKTRKDENFVAIQ